MIRYLTVSIRYFSQFNFGICYHIKQRISGLFRGHIYLAIIADSKCPLKIMFQLCMTLSVTKIMARVKCAILIILCNHVILMLPR